MLPSLRLGSECHCCPRASEVEQRPSPSALVNVIKITQRTKICQCHIKKWKQSSFSVDELGQEHPKFQFSTVLTPLSPVCSLQFLAYPQSVCCGCLCLLPVSCASYVSELGPAPYIRLCSEFILTRENLEREESYFTKALTESHKRKNLLTPADPKEHLTLQMVIKTHPDDLPIFMMVICFKVLHQPFSNCFQQVSTTTFTWTHTLFQAWAQEST